MTATFTRDLEWRHNGRHVNPGTELSVQGERGRYRFVAHTMNEQGDEWIDCYGGPAGYASWRSFAPERIRTVHAKEKTR